MKGGRVGWVVFDGLKVPDGVFAPTTSWLAYNEEQWKAVTEHEARVEAAKKLKAEQEHEKWRQKRMAEERVERENRRVLATNPNNVQMAIKKTNFGRVPPHMIKSPSISLLPDPDPFPEFDSNGALIFYVSKNSTVREIINIFRSQGASYWMSDRQLLNYIGIYLPDDPKPSLSSPLSPYSFSMFDRSKSPPVPPEFLEKNAFEVGLKSSSWTFSQLPPGACD